MTVATPTRHTSDHIKRVVTEIICNSLGVDPAEVTPDADFIHDLGCDSLDVVELVMAVEEEFSLAIDDEQAEEFRFVRDLTDFLVKEIGL